MYIANFLCICDMSPSYSFLISATRSFVIEFYITDIDTDSFYSAGECLGNGGVFFSVAKISFLRNRFSLKILVNGGTFFIRLR